MIKKRRKLTAGEIRLVFQRIGNLFLDGIWTLDVKDAFQSLNQLSETKLYLRSYVNKRITARL